MAESSGPINSVAPLANVARLQQLVLTIQKRVDGLPGMGCYYGPAGFGKTTAGMYVTNKFNACHVEALPFGGASKLLEMIVTELGLNPARSVPALFDQAVFVLRKTGRPLIIDEADHILTAKVIETIRLLYDKTLVPVILMGEEHLPQKLRQWERVHGRMLAWVPAEPATMEDVGFLTPIYAPGVAIAEDLMAAVLMSSAGSLRNVSTSLARIATYAAISGKLRLDRAEWGERSLHTGEAPQARRGLGPVVPISGRRRRSAA